VARNFSNLLQAAPYHDLPKRAAASDTVLVSTAEMQNSLARLYIPSRLMPTIGLQTRELPWQSHRPIEGPLRLLFVGKIITLKGIDLALEALGASGVDATLTVIGTGNFHSAAQRLVKKLGLEKRVTFRGQLTREQVLKAYSEFDLMLFPSLHDTGGYAVIEAMFNELPVICLDCGGPAVAVQPGCGIRVPIGRRRRVIEELADAIRLYDRDRQTLLIHGQAARQTILKNYDWDQKGEQMKEVYDETLTQATEPSPTNSRHARAALASRRLVSFKGSLVAIAILLLVGTIGFLTLNHLKTQASLIVNDTLPGLSYAGEANAYIVDASRTLLFVTDKDAGRRRQIHDDIDSFGARTTRYLALYRNQIFGEEDRTNFEHLVEMRGKYLEIRDRILNLAAAGKENEALIVYNESLMPMHSEVKKAADKLFEYNMKQGQLRGQRIMRLCTITQIVLGLVSVLVFALGFFFGLFK
jgi:hypothetical protein